jgi:hypothetical protein
MKKRLNSIARVFNVIFILVSVFLLADGHHSPARQIQPDAPNELILRGKVIGVERPEFYHPPYGPTTVLYIKVAQVIKGNEEAKYIRVGYGCVPSSDANVIDVGQATPCLPAEMFDGKSLWKFSLKRQEHFDQTVEVSKTPDEVTEGPSKRKRNVITFPKYKPKCVATPGNEKEAMQLEQAGKLRGYYLEEKSYEKAK